MSNLSPESSMQKLIREAVTRSGVIGDIVIDRGALQQLGEIYSRFHGHSPALIIADENTHAAAGREAAAILASANVTVETHILPACPRPKPTIELGETLIRRMAGTGMVPLAVGSGVINDLVKYAAFRLGSPYGCIATAASMDGYASAGSPLSDKGFKITIQCRPPVIILADLDVIARAPPQMAGWGFGDLAGKVAAGGDWILADALAIETVDDVAWPLVQDHLREWLSAPEDVARGDPRAIADLLIGLTAVGLAMEFHGTSRPASGADHQIAHMWEMENLTHAGEIVAHGACVAIGALTVLGLYDWLLGRDLGPADVERAMDGAESMDEKRRQIDRFFGNGQIARRAVEETRAKHIEGDALRARLRRLTGNWPAIRARLHQQLMPQAQMHDLLLRAGAPVTAGEIGVSTRHLHATTLAARFLRSRYTVLDVLAELGLLQVAVDETVPPARTDRSRGE